LIDLAHHPPLPHKGIFQKFASDRTRFVDWLLEDRKRFSLQILKLYGYLQSCPSAGEGQSEPKNHPQRDSTAEPDRNIISANNARGHSGKIATMLQLSNPVSICAAVWYISI
jgi:hypothetical protein